jgi:hypothetical protein
MIVPNRLDLERKCRATLVRNKRDNSDKKRCIRICEYKRFLSELVTGTNHTLEAGKNNFISC